MSIRKSRVNLTKNYSDCYHVWMIRMCCHESLYEWHFHRDQVDCLYSQCKLEVVCHKEVEEPIFNMVEFPKGKKPKKGQNEQ